MNSQSITNHATRKDWLKVALDALHKEGPKGLNIQALARQLQISKTSFYLHFKDKADLCDALVDFWCHKVTETVIGNMELRNSSPRPRRSLTNTIWATMTHRSGYGPELNLSWRKRCAGSTSNDLSSQAKRLPNSDSTGSTGLQGCIVGWLPVNRTLCIS